MITRRTLLQTSAGAGLLTGVGGLLPAWAQNASKATRPPALAGVDNVYDLSIGKRAIDIGGRMGDVTAVNGSLPAPLLRFRQGETVTLRVANELDEDTSIHWHGILLASEMDGVPNVSASFPGIPPGETFVYQYTLKQSGTYWYHSHSGLQEPAGVYGPMIVDPAGRDPVAYDREHVIVLSDWSFENPDKIFAKLKKSSDYYNYQKRTIGDLFRDVSNDGLKATMRERRMWGRMRMDATDTADITGATYTYLMNGQAPGTNWTGLFQPGERVRLRFVNAAAMSYFNIRIPGLEMTVVEADGQLVQPVTTDEFQISVAETYDVIVEPKEDRAYTIMAESMDRSGYARGTLATSAGMTAAVPEIRPRAIRTMADMAMDHSKMAGMAGMSGMDDTPDDGMSGMDHGNMDHGAKKKMDHSKMGHGDKKPVDHSKMNHGAMKGMDNGSMKGMDHGSMKGDAMAGAPIPKTSATPGGPFLFGPGVAMRAEMPGKRLHERGFGLADVDHRVLVYTDLRALEPFYDQRPPAREIELHLTSNMERYMWSFDGKKFNEVTGPIPFKFGERLRLTMINNTMMDHPIHLHGMWMELENGAGDLLPRKHTINVKPGEKLSALISADARGPWAFHCHLLYHMKAGMFRVVSVMDQIAEARL
jgi:FtsP/CotA-like multicopper oxidase with cupredoxin domain